MADVISPESVRVLPGLFCERVRRSPGAVAYTYYDAPTDCWMDLSWSDMALHIVRWQTALKNLNLEPGDRVAIMANNSPRWVMFEQAALGLGLVVVPLFFNDRPDNVAYVLGDCGARLLLIENLEQWHELECIAEQLDPELHLWSINDCGDGKVQYVAKLLSDEVGCGQPEVLVSDGEALATIVYTSGTTGRPKGVMLSHHNILWNAYAGLQVVPIYPDDYFLSFLPLSHTLERTIGYYLPMMAGAGVAYARSIPKLAEDLATMKPTVMISVPRIYERVYGRVQEQLGSDLKQKLFRLAVEVGWLRFQHRQGRAKWQSRLLLWPLLNRLVAGKIMARLGGRLRIAICGGAPLSVEVGRTFVGLGLNLLQGYGMTESSPVIAVNRTENNDPASVGPPLPDVELRIGADDELLARSPGVTQGYWHNPEATAETVDAEGWLHTGDKARIDAAGRVYITGRLKDVIVLANGEKVSPGDMETAIATSPLFEQVMVIGDNRSFLAALVVMSEEAAGTHYSDHLLLDAIAERIKQFPGYAQVRRVLVIDEPWSVENGLLTPTLKPKREKILQAYAEQIEQLYDQQQRCAS
jgi:long-chain acyl-CoA synthetase